MKWTHSEIENCKPRRSKAFALTLPAAIFLISGCHSLQPDSNSTPVAAPAVEWQSAYSEVQHSDTLVHSAEKRNDMDGQTLIQVSADELGHDMQSSAALDLTIDLATAFQLAGVGNPTINLAREVVREAAARHQAAQVLLLPNLTIGGNINVHRGVLQRSTGIITEVDRQAVYAGNGAGAIGAQTVGIPGVRLFSHLGDAIYEPLAARQKLLARRSVAAATENRILLETAMTYFDLLGAEVRLEAFQKSVREVGEIARLTTAYAKNGQGRAGDMHRAEANVRLVQRQIQEAEENVAVASASLARLLNLDPSTRLRTPGGTIQPLSLIDENQPLPELIEQGMTNRPEIAARWQELAEAGTRVRQERIRPLLPTLSIGFSAGTFGGGSNLTVAGITQTGGGVEYGPRLGKFDGRTDFDVLAVWTLQNAGAGNRALANRAEAVRGQVLAELDYTINQVRREIATALADTQAAARQIELNREQLKIAEDGFRAEMIRIHRTVGRPLETIDSFRQLMDAQQEILRSVIAYNSAQYRLFVAVGASPLGSGCGTKP